MSMQFIGIGTLGTEMSPRDRRLGVAFNGDQLAFPMVNKLPASHAAVWADRASNFCAVDLGSQIPRAIRHGFGAGSIGTIPQLLNKRPARKKFSKHEIAFRQTTLFNVRQMQGYSPYSIWCKQLHREKEIPKAPEKSASSPWTAHPVTASHKHLLSSTLAHVSCTSGASPRQLY